MVFPVHLHRSAVVAIRDCPDRAQFIWSLSLKQAALQWIWLFQEAPCRCAPHILFGLSRDGLFLPVFARVNEGCTPDAALLLTTAVTAALILCGDFWLLLGVSVFINVLPSFSGTTSLFLLSTVIGDSTNSLMAAGLIVLSLPAPLLSRRMSTADLGSG
jgi:hypothetical protein